ncbi:hypothetical protein F4779DRAFT_65562 [Xylariaceae sp. FL0662B]|nr:hypothetical protein F4779DRAFT_65562 [Xylariaceae sp. FL0662B]
MALSRSASGPSGLSINTSSANLFGSSSSQPPAPGGLFGSASNSQQTQTSQPQTASTLFGGASTPKPSPGLFGNTPSTTATANATNTTTTTTTSQPQQTTSMFGSTPSSQPQPSGGLFGSSSTTPQPQQTGGGLFGGANTATSQPQQPSGGLFGNAQSGQSQMQNTGGLFGGSTAGQPTSTNNPSSDGLFNNLSKPSQPATNTFGSTMFGQSSQQKPSPFGSLGQSTQTQTFGQPQPQQSSMGLGGSLSLGLTMGQSSTQQTIPGVRIDLSNIKGTTRFNDLQEDLQKQIIEVDCFIQRQIEHKQEVDSFIPNHGEMLESIPNDVKFVARKYDGAENALESAAEAIKAARELVSQDADHARLSFRAIDNLKLPEQYHTSGIWSPRQQPAGTTNTEADGQDLVNFFSKTADEIEEQMTRYERNMTEIEMHMHGVSDGLVEQLQRMMATKNGAASSADEKIRELVAVLREFEQGILKVAGDVGSVREAMTRLQLGDFIANDGSRNGVY